MLEQMRFLIRTYVGGAIAVAAIAAIAALYLL